MQTKADPTHKGRGAPPPAYNHYFFKKNHYTITERIAYITKAGDSACTKIILKEAGMSTKLNNKKVFVNYLLAIKETADIYIYVYNFQFKIQI